MNSTMSQYHPCCNQNKLCKRSACGCSREQHPWSTKFLLGPRSWCRHKMRKGTVKEGIESCASCLHSLLPITTHSSPLPCIKPPPNYQSNVQAVLACKESGWPLPQHYGGMTLVTVDQKIYKAQRIGLLVKHRLKVIFDTITVLEIYADIKI